MRHRIAPRLKAVAFPPRLAPLAGTQRLLAGGRPPLAFSPILPPIRRAPAPSAG